LKNQLERIISKSPRAAEYFSVKELQAQTGQPVENFATVILKELLDNALDEAEKSGTPEIYIGVTETPEHYIITVQDNGRGFPEEAIDGIMNFNISASTKNIYVSPTRGTQGNALKTILGIPFALGCRAPLIIESRGKTHQILGWIDPAGMIRTEHRIEDIGIQQGSRITVTIPKEGQNFDPAHWIKAFAIFNPHAFVKFIIKQKFINQAKSEGIVEEGIYKSVANKFSKQTVLDLTSPWWYSRESMERLIFSYINKNRKDKKDMPLGEFIRQFRGLTSTRKAKLVGGQIPTVTKLSDFESYPELVSVLLKAMQTQTKPPSPTTLGIVGEGNFRCRFNDCYNIGRFWYAKSCEIYNGIPNVFEVALAEVNDEKGALFHGVNYSATYEDPLVNTLLKTKDIYALGLENFLSNSYCHTERKDNYGNKPIVVAVHLISPVIQFMDRGKTRLKLKWEIANSISSCLEKVTQTLLKEEKRRSRDAAREERKKAQVLRQEIGPNIKECVFHVLPAAIQKATGEGKYPVSARSLYYQVRPLIQEYTNKELEYSYFSQTLLTEYQKNYGTIAALYYDPRGYLLEPHTGQSLPIGTLDVKNYKWPQWLYNKVLYVEKKGLLPTLQAARIAERYDIAIIAAEGFATEAARLLLKRASKDLDYKLFVIHDADPAGYEIARTLQEETQRMPGYSVEVIDLGLRVKEAVNMGLEVERFTRRKRLSSKLTLETIEREFFEGKQQTPKSWVAKRIELNAMTGPQLVNFIESKLRLAGATAKVLPPEEVIKKEAGREYVDKLRDKIREEVIIRLNVSNIVQNIMDDIAVPTFDILPEKIGKALKRNPPKNWQEFMLDEVEEEVKNAVNQANWEKL